MKISGLHILMFVGLVGLVVGDQRPSNLTHVLSMPTRLIIARQSSDTLVAIADPETMTNITVSVQPGLIVGVEHNGPISRGFSSDTSFEERAFLFPVESPLHSSPPSVILKIFEANPPPHEHSWKPLGSNYRVLWESEVFVEKEKSSNNGLESTGAPPAAGTPETHP